MPKPTIDYSLYLVTGRELLPSGKVSLASPVAVEPKLMMIIVPRTIMRVWKRSVVYRCSVTVLIDQDSLCKAELHSFRCEKRR
jgi:hypothetical protein